MAEFIKTHIENGMDELEIEVEFDYEPYEPSTRHYPGCSESVDICGVMLVGGSEICLLPDYQSTLEENILLDS